MSFNVFYTTVRTIIKRIIIHRKLVHLEKVKYNSVREKHKLNTHFTYWDHIRSIISYPLTLFNDYVCYFLQLLYASIFARRQTRRREGQMRKVFRNMTQENHLFRKLFYFLLGLILTYLSFLFLYFNNVLTNYYMIVATIALSVLFLLIAPFKQSILCLILIALPSLFSSKIRYILVAYIVFTLHFQVLPNVFNNGIAAMNSVGCSFSASSNGTKEMGRLMVKDITNFVKNLKQRVKKIKDDLLDFLNNFTLNIKVPSINLKAMCNEPTDKDIGECEKQGVLEKYVFCDYLWRAFSGLCDEIKEKVEQAYNKTKQIMLDQINKLICQISFNATVEHQFEYHYLPSKNPMSALKNIGNDWMDRNWWLRYLEYAFDIRFLLLIIVSLWIFINSVIYLYRFKKSDHFDNVYLSDDLVKIDKQREQIGRETVFPLQFEESQVFIHTFDLIMTRVERVRLLLGLLILAMVFYQIAIYFMLDYMLFSFIDWYNGFIDILAHIFAPAQLTLNITETKSSFIGSRLNQLKEGVDVKKKIFDNLQRCKATPLKPNDRVYDQIKFLFIAIFFTVICGAYGLRLRHYIAGIFYPKRIPIRAVWLYNDILCRRGSIFKFWRKQMNKKVFGDKTTESFTFLDRVCSQYPIIRLICRIVGLYGKQHYCQNCGRRVMADGSDHSTKCANDCTAIYCEDCIDDRNNICSICMNPIDYNILGDFSEELDSSDEDIAYEIQNEDFLYQFSSTKPNDESEKTEMWDDHDIDINQRRDLVSFAYRYDSVDRVPKAVYLVDEDNGYDGDNDTEVTEEYQKNLFELEKQLGIPAQDIARMKQNAMHMVDEDFDENIELRAKQDKYSQLKREDDQRLVRNSMVLVNRDRKKYRKRPNK